jgi:hypothetical protein
MDLDNNILVAFLRRLTERKLSCKFSGLFEEVEPQLVASRQVVQRLLVQSTSLHKF